MCTHGGTRYGSTGCRRTYLSQRDLQAHINHRHVSSISQPEPMMDEKPSIRPKGNDPRGPLTIATNMRQRPNPIQPTGGIRTNLITVPIQDSSPIVHEATGPPQTYYNQYQPNPTYSQSLPPMHIPPPQQAPYYTTASYSAPQPYPPYNTPAPPPQYNAPTIPQSRPPTQYEYPNAPPPQWPTNQQYYR